MIVCVKFVTSITLTCSIAPVDTFATVELSLTLLFLGMIIASILNASALLKIAPKLCGSSNESRITKTLFTFSDFSATSNGWYL